MRAWLRDYPRTTTSCSTSLSCGTGYVPNQTRRSSRRSSWALSATAEGSPWLADTTFAIDYDSWSYGHFSELELEDENITRPLADPDRDGFVNLVEYALCSDPQSASSRPTWRVEASDDGFIEVTFKRLLNAIDIDITPQVSGDLGTWNSAAASQVSETTNGDGSATVVITLPLALGEQFARVQVSNRLP